MSYGTEGFVLCKGLALTPELDALEAHFIAQAEARFARHFEGLESEDLASLIGDDREAEQALYNDKSKLVHIHSLGLAPKITREVKKVLGEDIGMFSHAPMRIDLPHVTREFAVWHQDYHYVKGNTDIVTAWVALVDVPYERGCLMVMPGSHRLGVLKHDREILGKRHFPSGIFDNPVALCPVERGDVVLFNSLMLHSSGLNLDTVGRYSLQIRYTRLNDPVNPAMGNVIRI